MAFWGESATVTYGNTEANARAASQLASDMRKLIRTWRGRANANRRWNNIFAGISIITGALAPVVAVQSASTTQERTSNNGESLRAPVDFFLFTVPNDKLAQFAVLLTVIAVMFEGFRRWYNNTSKWKSASEAQLLMSANLEQYIYGVCDLLEALKRKHAIEQGEFQSYFQSVEGSSSSADAARTGTPLTTAQRHQQANTTSATTSLPLTVGKVTQGHTALQQLTSEQIAAMSKQPGASSLAATPTSAQTTTA